MQTDLQRKPRARLPKHEQQLYAIHLFYPMDSLSRNRANDCPKLTSLAPRVLDPPPPPTFFICYRLNLHKWPHPHFSSTLSLPCFLFIPSILTAHANPPSAPVTLAPFRRAPPSAGRAGKRPSSASRIPTPRFLKSHPLFPVSTESSSYSASVLNPPTPFMLLSRQPLACAVCVPPTHFPRKPSRFACHLRLSDSW